MASRDLTLFFERSRAAFHRGGSKAFSVGNGSDGDLLRSSASGGGVDMSSLALSGASPVYVETVNELQADLASITTRCECARSAVPPLRTPPLHMPHAYPHTIFPFACPSPPAPAARQWRA